jgi:hypothetical protein
MRRQHVVVDRPVRVATSATGSAPSRWRTSRIRRSTRSTTGCELFSTVALLMKQVFRIVAMQRNKFNRPCVI